MNPVIKRLGEYTECLERGLISLCFVALLLLALVQILARNLFDTGFIWADDAIRVLVLWVAMLGALYATKQAKHITIDVASRFLPDGFAVWLRRGLYLMTAVVCLVAAWHSWLFVMMEMEYPEVAFLNVPVWLCEIIIPLALLGMALRFILLIFIGVGDRHGEGA